MINVRDFHAMGDGITDDSPSLLSAIRTATPLGETILFPPGIYRLSANTVASQNVKFKFQSGAVLKIDPTIKISIYSAHHIISLLPAKNKNSRRWDFRFYCPWREGVPGLVWGSRRWKDR